MLAYLLLGLAQVIGLLMIPLGAPGVWIQLAALVLFGWWTGFATVGPVPVLVLVLLALSAELVEALLVGPRMNPARRRTSAFAGLAGGGAGAALGVPFPLLGNVFGALAGAFTGSLIAAVAAHSGRVGCAPLVAQVIATTTKTATGVIVAVFSLLIVAR